MITQVVFFQRLSSLGINLLRPGDAISRHRSGSNMAQVMAWRRQAFK